VQQPHPALPFSAVWRAFVSLALHACYGKQEEEDEASLSWR
jgi:hypothetical protein